MAHRGPIHRRTRLSAAALLALAAAACSDRANPVAPTPAPPGTPGAPVTIQALQCTADRNAMSVSCASAQPAGGAQGDIIVGNQNVYVKLTSTNVAYNAGTGRFTFDVTVQNLIQQPMGTTDGTTLDPGGIKVFFSQEPTVTAGSGTAAAVPDGFGTFTAAGQPYYQYNELLVQNAVSAAHGWTFIIAPTVVTFHFLVYVSAPVEYPDGYIELDGHLPGYDYGYLHPSSTHPLAAVVKTATGNVLPGQVVTFGTTNPGCATVDGAGTVTGVQFATCSITATSGIRSGSMVFQVSGATRSWTGAVSTDWNVGGNWGGGLVPATADSVVVPFPSPNYPVLTSAVTISDVTVADQATVAVATFVLTSTGNVGTGATVGSGILASGAGSVLLSGSTKAVHGRFPTTLVTGTYSLDGNYHGVAPQSVDAGTITADLFEMDVDAQ